MEPEEPIVNEPNIEEPEPNPETETVPLATFLEKKSEARELREENAQMRGRIEALEKSYKPKEEQEEKSPLEKWVEANPEVAPDGETLLAQRKWDAKQSSKKAKAETAAQNEKTLQRQQAEALENYSEEKVGIGLDMESIVTKLGAKYLTAGDRVDISNAAADGKNPFEFAYKRVLSRIREEGGATAEKIKARQQAHKKLQKKDDSTEEKEKKPKKKQEENSEEEPLEETDFTPLTKYIFSEE
jgi:hypothetical protein